ncbi:hypothetical protein TELCIR_20065 [Teladorsagia circumcincta]|uniref:Uncharacterized protein n=1 Tax=Teladorsagia circumcincta TaxID=45464 RepID=A0A2G9TKJ5_TELCI|nr:hypothetical protein TELCIR_20065 [Teladorsagia circumcincta]
MYARNAALWNLLSRLVRQRPPRGTARPPLVHVITHRIEKAQQREILKRTAIMRRRRNNGKLNEKKRSLRNNRRKSPRRKFVLAFLTSLARERKPMRPLVESVKTRIQTRRQSRSMIPVRHAH